VYQEEFVLFRVVPLRFVEDLNHTDAFGPSLERYASHRLRLVTDLSVDLLKMLGVIIGDQRVDQRLAADENAPSLALPLDPSWGSLSKIPHEIGRFRADGSRTEEAIAIANVIPERAVVAILDQHGSNLDSATLAGLLRDWRAEDRPAACFVIGSADGLAQTLTERAKFKLAFGAATWPHQLVRVMLLEQIYRAGTILSGHPYHRA
jgi:23S rRNA (pseudouridine1915-N3)-methyltransferase